MKKHYVLGFVFSRDYWDVVVLKKERPERFRGLWNGVGGHVEEGETALQAMCRECFEETGLTEAQQGVWKLVAILDNEDARTDVFAAESSLAYQAATTTDEQVQVMATRYILNNPNEFVFNAPWLILMAQQLLRGHDRAQYYRIEADL